MKSNPIATSLMVALNSIMIMSCDSPTRLAGPDKNPAAKAKDTPLTTLGSFQRIQGTPYLMAPINDLGTRSSNLSSYSKGGQTRNRVFLNAESLASEQLFDTNAFIILNTTEYSKQVDAKSVTQWLVYQVLTQDTDGNGQLDQDDHRTLGVSDADGKGYAEVLTGVSQLFGITMVKSGQLVVVYTKGGVKNASLVDLANRKVMSTKAIVDLGPNVQ